ncbi:ATP-binding cassette domain-containing protein [uncultured Thiodictyon sp.]|uniref:ATP-binding cassette domain-containing protein n=1 Tax=uncultured Thiodictyon sp. TaxID=1846217 RepID=UPI0025D6C003|nr:ATP-binding cassette domain-containing protein [uncultured Thiodictyon sp.]
MSSAPDPAALAWPAERLGEAVAALGQARGWADAWTDPGRSGSGRPGDGEDGQLARIAAQLGLEAEPVETDYAGMPRLLERCAPAVLALPDGRFLPVLRRRGKDLQVLDQQQVPRALPLESVRQRLCAPLCAELAADLAALTNIAELTGRRGAKSSAALRDGLLAQRRVRAGWLVRPASGAPLGWQAGEFRVSGLLGTLLGAHALGFLLWLGSWWLLGEGVFSGHLDLGWLQAWALLLLTLLPLHLLASRASGLFAIRGGAVLKRRLLAGALRLDPDEVRHLGIGRLLGCILEADLLEQMAVSGGFLGLTGLVELGLAGGLLALSPVPGPLLALAAWALVGAGFAAHYLRCQRRWTETRLLLTDALVDTMVGHRTRAVQEPKDQWNRREDAALAGYYRVCRSRDRAALLLKTLLPRGGFLIGIAALVPAFAAGAGASAAPLAVALGGVLVAYLALRHLADGLEQLLGAWVAFGQVRLFWQAATRPQSLGDPQASAAADSAPPGIAARNLVYRHAGRTEPVLRGASLAVDAGERLLLQGASGSGKSTLAAILAGQRQAQAGLCLLGGLDRASLGEQLWRRRIALVPQFHENHILMGTLAFNLLLGRAWPPSAADLEEAQGLCRALGLGPLLERMPGGLMQQVGETGWQLSHGERERIYIARALLQGAQIIILDESVSSLDPRTLRETMAVLWERAPTLILIAHL